VPRIDGPSILVAEESAIIVWDPVKKVQHFIRRAAFDTKSPDFGFLVPTPTMPKLPFAEVEDGIFHAVGAWLQPKTVERDRWEFGSLFCFGATAREAAAPSMAPGGVRVLHEQKVGGYEVNVLEADDAEKLTRWIKERGFSADPELYDWLKPYIAGGWKITAFKIMQDPASGKLATTKAVRTSFQTDRPFFPYREPESKPKSKDKRDANGPRRSDGRLLNIVLVSNARMAGQLGNSAWNATIPWADQLTGEQRTQLARETGVPEDEIPAQAWLTSFEDRALVRPSKDDVYFEPSSDQTPVRPPDIVRYRERWIPIDCIVLGICLVALIAGVIIWRLRRA
jgi:hypothetical protein